MQFQYLYETTGLTGVVLSVVWYILILAAGWKMYEKANEPGWKSIIPIYNTYTCYKFTWDTKIFWPRRGLHRRAFLPQAYFPSDTWVWGIGLSGKAGLMAEPL